MRKMIYAALASASLATASMASAAVVVNSGGSVDLNNPYPTAFTAPNGVTTINFGANPAPSPTFTDSFSFNNTAAGLYTILIGTTNSDLTFTSGTLAGAGGTINLTAGTNAITGTSILGAPATFLAAGTYTLTYSGNNPVVGGSYAGTATITPAVPEPATWALMLLGFGGIGFAMRRRRNPALAQIA